MRLMYRIMAAATFLVALALYDRAGVYTAYVKEPHGAVGGLGPFGKVYAVHEHGWPVTFLVTESRGYYGPGNWLKGGPREVWNLESQSRRFSTPFAFSTSAWR